MSPASERAAVSGLKVAPASDAKRSRVGDVPEGSGTSG